MERTRSFSVSLLLALFAILLSFSFVACSSTTVSGATIKTDKFSLKRVSDECKEAGDGWWFKSDTSRNTTTTYNTVNSYQVFYTDSSVASSAKAIKVKITPYSDGSHWKEFKGFSELKFVKENVTSGDSSRVWIDYSDLSKDANSLIDIDVLDDEDSETYTFRGKNKEGNFCYYKMTWKFAKAQKSSTAK